MSDPADVREAERSVHDVCMCGHRREHHLDDTGRCLVATCGQPWCQCFRLLRTRTEQEAKSRAG